MRGECLSDGAEAGGELEVEQGGGDSRFDRVEPPLVQDDPGFVRLPVTIAGGETAEMVELGVVDRGRSRVLGPPTDLCL